MSDLLCNPGVVAQLDQFRAKLVDEGVSPESAKRFGEFLVGVVEKCAEHFEPMIERATRLGRAEAAGEITLAAMESGSAKAGLDKAVKILASGGAR